MEIALQHLKDTIHPCDKTGRPKCVYLEWNPDYHALISAFKRITGIGAVLNTGFNLHAEPNVCSPHDASNTMDNLRCKYLAIGSFLLKKR